MGDDLFNFSGFFQSLSLYGWWRVAIELVLIGTVVGWVLSFLRGTRGARMLKGIAFILITLYLIVRLVAGQFELQRVEFLYTKFLLFASFAIIVVFQPELRRALMRLGETRFFRGWTNQLSDEIEQIVEAAEFLSRRKIGALIAIEREIGLGGIAEMGTRLNADITANLLETIFWPNSPLHDLGVVISQGRIAYAGVQFPLAESGELEQELGSRHRAAVGMSQESDAVILVVSEETGDISIAEKGQLFRKLNIDAVRDLLAELLGRTDAISFSDDEGSSDVPAASDEAEKDSSGKDSSGKDSSGKTSAGEVAASHPNADDLKTEAGKETASGESPEVKKPEDTQHSRAEVL